MSTTYDDDYFAWANAQAALLREVKPEWLDWRNLAEEVDDLGISQRSALESHLEIVLIHLLKWRYQPRRRSLSWETSVENGRDHAAEILELSPSLRRRLDEAQRVAYRRARRLAAVQMRWSKRERELKLPAACEWTVEQVLNPDFWPEAAG
jgi:hypothetical protein